VVSKPGAPIQLHIFLPAEEKIVSGHTTANGLWSYAFRIPRVKKGSVVQGAVVATLQDATRASVTRTLEIRG
jgi:hypothetical protein